MNASTKSRVAFADVDSFVGVSRREILVRTSLWLLLFNIIVVSGFYLLYRAEISKSTVIREAASMESINLSAQLISEEILDAFSDIGYLARQNELYDLMNGAGAGAAARLGAEYTAYLLNKRVYDQLRFIGADGREVVRANYNDGNPQTSPQEHLQDKSGRYYYRQAMAMDPGKVYLSRFDLNVEHGRLEEPTKPIIRIGMQVCDPSGNGTGLVVLNYLGRHLLDRITTAGRATGVRVWMTDAEGYWLKGPVSKDEWGFILPGRSQRTLANAYPEVWQRVQDMEEGQFYSRGDLFTFTRIRPRLLTAEADDSAITVPADYHWIVLSNIPREVFLADRWSVVNRLLLLFLMIILLLAPLSWLLARLTSRQKALASAMSMMVDNVPALICYVDSDRRFRFNNRAYSTFFGLDREKLTGCRLADVLGTEGYEQVRPYVNRALAGERVNFQQRIDFRDIGTRAISASYVPDFHDDGSVHGFFGVVNDITELDEARENERQRLLELAHAQRINSMGEMATEIAHEINQPLATIANFSTACERTLQSGKLDDEQLLAWITEIRSHAKRASEIVRRLRSFLRNKETVYTQTDINALIRDVVGWLQGEIRSHNIVVAMELQTEIPKVMADEILLQQVILNLLRNAVEALREVPDCDRRLEVRSRADGRWVRVTVSDSGPGIPASIDDRIFFSFVTSKEQGLGMGLSVSRSIVETHGGSLTVDRTSESMTSFMFTLPLEVER